LRLFQKSNSLGYSDNMQKLLAIDLLDGCIVRLKKGDYASVTVYSSDPLGFIQQKIDAGISHFHLVDLSGARETENSQLGLISQMLKLPASFQIGGGIRTLAKALGYYELGAQRLVIGTKAFEQSTDFLGELAKQIPTDAIVVGLDVMPIKQDFVEQSFMIMTHAWQQASPLSLSLAMSRILALGIRHCLCTDISRDGMLEGPNLALYRFLKIQYPDILWTASGGIRGLPDIAALEALSMHSAVIGKAFYGKYLTLEDMLC